MASYCRRTGTQPLVRRKLFVDGGLEATLTDTTGTFVEVSSVPWNIGNVPGSGGIRFPWDGLIDEVEIFDRALTAAEIKAIYDAGSAGKRKPAPQAAVVDQAYEPASVTMATGRLDPGPDLYGGHYRHPRSGRRQYPTDGCLGPAFDVRFTSGGSPVQSDVAPVVSVRY